MSNQTQHVVPPYGVAIHQAIAVGDLTQMKALLAQAQTLLAQQGELAAAISLVKQEIAKLERT
ncbi:MAG TPA: DUF1843 domain-containing protein [Paraburkholderia sp.]|jgi:hypothetical protein|nr:DUF1843 domain-containing protein [Paraburkholderia sp.]